MDRLPDARIKRAEALINDPLNQEFFEKSKEAIYDALERVNEQDLKALQSIAQMAKWRAKFQQFYQSFIDNGKIADFQEKSGVRDRINRFWRGN